MNIAIVGSRTFTDGSVIRQAIERMIQKYPDSNLTIVSGGAAGADTLGAFWARELSLPTIIHHPEWAKYGRSAGFRRNALIVRDADIILAFFSPGLRSNGTQNTVSTALSLGKVVHIYHERWLS